MPTRWGLTHAIVGLEPSMLAEVFPFGPLGRSPNASGGRLPLPLPLIFNVFIGFVVIFCIYEDILKMCFLHFLKNVSEV